MMPTERGGARPVPAAVAVLVVAGMVLGTILAVGSPDGVRWGPPRAEPTRGVAAALADTPRGPQAATPTTNGSGWLNLTPSLRGAVPPKGPAVLVYDPVSTSDLLVPASNASPCSFVYAAGQWSCDSAYSPAGTFAPALAWGDGIQEAVAFGGMSGTAHTATNGTWLFSNSGGWTYRHYPSAPSARWGASMAWDPSDGYLLLFGGTNGTAVFNDTWAFNGQGWSQLTPTTVPPARSGAALVDDVAGDAVVLFGGNGTTGTLLNDTWTFQDGDWQALTPRLSPPTRYDALAAYDAATASVVVFGGFNPRGIEEQDTWFFSGGAWTGGYAPTYPTPAARAMGGMAESPTGNGLLLFGGEEGIYALNDTWQFYTLEPQATAAPTRGEGPLSVNFTAVSRNGEPPLSYLWTFGDGTASYAPNATHDYASTGRYVARLTVTDEYGVQGVYNLTIVEVLPLALSVDLVPTAGVAPLHVAGSATVTDGAPPYAITWQFGAGPTVPGPSASDDYALPGTYAVSVWANDSFGRSLQRSFTVTVLAEEPAPTMNVTLLANRTVAMAPGAIAFTAAASGPQPAIAVTWTFGDGAAGSGGNVSHTYAAPGRYLVTASALDAAGTTGAATTTVRIVPVLAVTANASTSPRGSATMVALRANASGGLAPYRYFWELGEAAGAAEGSNVSTEYPPDGSVSVAVEVVDALGDIARENLSVPLPAPPTATAPAGPSWTATYGPALILGGAVAGGLFGGILVTTALTGRRSDRSLTPARSAPARPGRPPVDHPPRAAAPRPSAPRSPPGRSRGGPPPGPPSA